jgi:hypothetical protein
VEIYLYRRRVSRTRISLRISACGREQRRGEDDKKVWEYQSALGYINKITTMFTAHIDSGNLAKIGGIVEGATTAEVQTNRNEMIAFNGSTELMS